MGLVIRPEAPKDAVAVRDVNVRAFGGPAEARIVEALRGSDGSLSLVAVADGRVVGHILFTPVQIEPAPADLRVAGLAPVSVLPDSQRQGVGSSLIEEGLARCRALAYAAVVVVGHAEYYPRFGFVPAHTRGLQYEHPVPPEAFMVLELEPAALEGVAGVVHYRPEFYEV